MSQTKTPRYRPAHVLTAERRELTKIATLIEEAHSRCECQVTYEGSISQELRDRLTRDGYRLKRNANCGDGPGGICVTDIEWGEGSDGR